MGMEQVLIVDDSMVARMSVRNALKETGAETKEAPCGEDALALVAGGYAPTLVFLDLTMPGIGGVETLRRLRDQGVSTKVIVVTADVQAATLAQLKGLDPFEVLRKPADKAAIQAAYAKAIGAL